jgi:hypothetical protein
MKENEKNQKASWRRHGVASAPSLYQRRGADGGGRRGGVRRRRAFGKQTQASAAWRRGMAIHKTCENEIRKTISYQKQYSRK